MDDVKKKIKKYLQVGDVCLTQGLLNEAKEQYVLAGQLIKKNDELKKNKNLIKTVSKKLQDVNEKISRYENEPKRVQLSKEVQEIIKSKFAFAKNDDAGALEGAIALAKFGQFEAALKEFTELVSRESIKLEAAKNIIRCHKALDTLDEAVALYQEWFSGDFFVPEQLNKLRIFFQGILDSQGIDVALPQKEEPGIIAEPEAVAESPEAVPEGELEEEEIIDISSVGIRLTEGPRKGETVEYDVSFQAGSVINLLISSDDKEFMETLRTGVMLSEVQFYSPIAMFNGRAVISSKSTIESGPKQGYYSLDIKVISIL
jgi:hypothetical protein